MAELKTEQPTWSAYIWPGIVAAVGVLALGSLMAIGPAKTMKRGSKKALRKLETIFEKLKHDYEKGASWPKEERAEVLATWKRLQNQIEGQNKALMPKVHKMRRQVDSMLERMGEPASYLD